MLNQTDACLCSERLDIFFLNVTGLDLMDIEETPPPFLHLNQKLLKQNIINLAFHK